MISGPFMWGLFHTPLKDPVIKQPGFNGKYPARFFDRGSSVPGIH